MQALGCLFQNDLSMLLERIYRKSFCQKHKCVFGASIHRTMNLSKAFIKKLKKGLILKAKSIRFTDNEIRDHFEKIVEGALKINSVTVTLCPYLASSNTTYNVFALMCMTTTIDKLFLHKLSSV